MTDCILSIGSYIREDLSGEKSLTEENLRERIEAYIQTRISTPIESVLIKESLDEATIEQINTLADPALFFVVNNLYINPTKITSIPTLANRL
jgi:hypothetical protein